METERKNYNLLAYISIGVYLLASLIWYMLTDAPWDDDCVSRYYSVKNAINEPTAFINRWNRPLFVLLFFLPFMISKHFVLLMTLYSAIGALYLYKACVKLKMPNAFLVVPFVLFQAYFYGTSRSSLAEPLAAVILCLGFYFLVEKKWLWFAVLGGLLPLARLELSLLLFAWGIILLKEKQWKYIFILAVPTVLWNVTGFILEGDPIWLWNETFGKDSGTNRYGHTTFDHYFVRYIFVTGPIIFYFLIIGFVQGMFKKKVSLFVHLQFVIGFFTYVLFSWKLSLGQAAGFLRHLIALAPLAAIISLHGVNYVLRTIRNSKREEKEQQEEHIDTTNVDLETEVQNNIEELNEKRDKGILKNREARHLINQEKKRLISSSNNKVKQKTKAKSTKGSFSDKQILIVTSLLIAAVTYFFLSKEIEIHHNLLATNDYTNFIIISALVVSILTLLLVGKGLNMKILRPISIGVIAIATVGFTLITEPPDVHNSNEREAMSEVAEIYGDSYLKNYKTYTNHRWILWVTGMSKSNFEDLTQENIENAPDSSIIIWDSHYGHRLVGDVPKGYFKDKPQFVELLDLWSSKLNFNVTIYQKLSNGSQKESIKANERFITSSPNSTAYAAKARRLEAFNQFKEAEVTFKKAIELDSTDFMTHSSYGSFLFSRSRFQEAKRIFGRNTKQRPDYYSAFFDKALCFSNLGNIDSAITYLSKSIELKPDFSRAYLERGIVYFEKNLYRIALNDFNRYVQLEPKIGIGYFNQAACKIRMNMSGCKELYIAKQYGYEQSNQVIAQFCKDYVPTSGSNTVDLNALKK